MNQNTLDTTRTKPTSFQLPVDLKAGRTEVLEGRTITKAAADRWHNLITTNFVIALGSRIQRSTSEIYVADMKVQVGPRSVCFPDIVLVSGEPVFSGDGSDTLQNPTAVVEIFSHSAPSTDRTAKLEAFLAIPSIKECILVNQDEMRIEHYARQNKKQWIYRIYNERDDVITLESLGCKINLTEIYAQVKMGDAKLSSKAVN